MSNVLFLDLETTGLKAQSEKILELGMIAVSTPDFEEIAAMWGIVRTSRADLCKMHPKVQTMHVQSGLWKEVEFDGVSARALEEKAIVFVIEQGLQGSVLCGSNPDFDRRFLDVHMPELAKLLHYRNFDTNSFWLLNEMLAGEKLQRDKGSTHRALADCRDAIQVVRDYVGVVEDMAARIEALTKGN